ncbi:MAG: DNA-directed RNA polymerase [Nanoarchaeota archaeon]|nr:DNA-directed RNA polymerase [Nanoarchaeota archaeon]MCG2718160.1 DNA-directed RNA polymerase [Nanoarchaeota archaeon]
MFYELEVKGHIRVPPNSFSEKTKDSILKRLNEKFEGYMSKDLGIIIGVSDVLNIGEGKIIPGDGAAYYDTTFKILSFKPELQEVVLGKITDITDFGAFIDVGPIDGMIHVSQTMDDFVSFSKSNVLTGKESKKSLKVNDHCRSRIIAVSFKDPSNPKIGLTMRQPKLGNLKWIEEELKKKLKATKTPAKKKGAK